MRADLAHIHTWIFDLDNTLYPASTNLFARIDERIGAYVARLFGCDPIEARRIEKDYFPRHGTTLAGLMAEHAIVPTDYLDDFPDLAPAQLERGAPLVAADAARPGPKLEFTTAHWPYRAEVSRLWKECVSSCISRW